MKFRLIQTGWDAEFDQAAKGCRGAIRIVTPFLQPDAVRRLLVKHPAKVSVITRFNLDELFRGVSSVQALRDLLDAGRRSKASATCTPRHIFSTTPLPSSPRPI